jgi:hypothetical protein
VFHCSVLKSKWLKRIKTKGRASETILIVGEDDSNLQGECRQGLFMKQKGSGFR